MPKMKPGSLEPFVLQSGKLSKDKGKLKGTTYNRFAAKIKELKLDPVEYTEELEFLRTVPKVQRFPAILTMDEAKAYIEKVVAPLIGYLEAVDTGDFPPVPQFSFACSWDCSYITPCRMENTGQDPEITLEAEFVQSDKSYRQPKSVDKIEKALKGLRSF